MKRVRLRRSEAGVSLLELVVSSALMVFVTAVLAELMLLAVTSTSRLTNQVDAFNATKFTIERIKNDIRTARAIGPSDRQTLTLYLPIFYTDPQNDPANILFNSGSAENEFNGIPLAGSTPFDTVQYKLEQDVTHPGEYLLKYSVTPGSRNFSGEVSYRKEVNPAQIILTGIVGPQDPLVGSDTPELFTFFLRDKYDPDEGFLGFDYSRTTPNAMDGVRVDIEVKRPKPSEQTDTTTQKTLAVHGEAFVRANKGN
ncbi:MAG: hypothetical protein AB7W16_29285 [Candidatus Obscuribacterales bacterium]